MGPADVSAQRTAILRVRLIEISTGPANSRLSTLTRVWPANLRAVLPNHVLGTADALQMLRRRIATARRISDLSAAAHSPKRVRALRRARSHSPLPTGRGASVCSSSICVLLRDLSVAPPPLVRQVDIVAAGILAVQGLDRAL